LVYYFDQKNLFLYLPVFAFVAEAQTSALVFKELWVFFDEDFREEVPI
jgi:hypothetical protein